MRLKRQSGMHLLIYGVNFLFFGNDRVRVNVQFNIIRDDKDLDNTEKLILDVLSNIVYSDDKKSRLFMPKRMILM